MTSIYESWEQFAYGNVCSPDAGRTTVAAQLRKSPFRSGVKQMVRVGAIFTSFALAAPAIGNVAAARLPQVQNQQIFKQLKLGPPLGKKVLELREFLKLSRSEAAPVLRVSEPALQKLEEGNTDSPGPEFFTQYYRFLELGDYLLNKTGGRRFVMVALFRSKLPAFDGKSAIDYAKSVEHNALPYITATFKRMYG